MLLTIQTALAWAFDQTWQKVDLPFAELFERWSYDAPALDNTVSPHPDISQVPSDDAVIHDNSLQREYKYMTHLKERKPLLL